MFSDATLPRLAAPRPPVAITAMLSFSLRLRPLTIAGAANKALAERAADVFRKRRRLWRDIALSLFERRLMAGGLHERIIPQQEPVFARFIRARRPAPSTSPR